MKTYHYFARAIACLLMLSSALLLLLAFTPRTDAQSSTGDGGRKPSGLPPGPNFTAGTLIIPTDISANGQDSGMLRAYGLVYALLRNHVPVYWIINPAKAAGGKDFSVPASNALQDVRTGATIAPRSYRGGPFVVSTTDAAAALSIIQPWQATAGDQTAVHRFVGSGALTLDVSRALVSAPRIGVIQDGNEAIAFNNLNAAVFPILPAPAGAVARRTFSRKRISRDRQRRMTPTGYFSRLAA